jgi:hypothetical protein
MCICYCYLLHYRKLLGSPNLTVAKTVLAEVLIFYILLSAQKLSNLQSIKLKYIAFSAMFRIH